MNRSTVIIFLLSYQIIFAGCVSMDYVRYDYSDGNGNVFRIIREKEITVEYVPVRPVMSSSGSYDGGMPVKKTVSAEALMPVIAALENAIRKTEIHIQSRVKLSGVISRYQSGNSTTVILSPEAEEIHLIEDALSRLLGK